MPPRPHITFYLYQLKNAIAADHPLWTSPLPLDRNASGSKMYPGTGAPPSYGAYFQAIEAFLKKNHHSLLSAAVSRQIERAIDPEEIREIRVCLEKHGPFYHPARVDVIGSNFCTKFVLNVAISKPGRDCIQKEYGYLAKLGHVTRGHFLPEVYGRDAISLTNDLEFSMFLGEWFDGFHEFHLYRNPLDHTIKLRVWAPEREHIFLSTPQSRELYRQASRILTHCYDVETTEHISSWHHASGDFIVRVEDNAIDVKLIAVRRYASALRNGNRTTETILYALLVFFLKLTLRMRLDRLDGVGELAWSDDIALQGSVLGFMEGLTEKPGIDLLPGPIDVCFMVQLANLDLTDLLDIARTILDTLPSESKEVPLIKQHLQQHLVVLLEVIEDFGGPLTYPAKA